MLELDNVSVRFGGLTAVDSVTLKVGSHDVIGLVGANGAGKTTLFNAISGLVRPTSGGIRFEGRDIMATPMYVPVHDHHDLRLRKHMTLRCLYLVCV